MVDVYISSSPVTKEEGKRRCLSTYTYSLILDDDERCMKEEKEIKSEEIDYIYSFERSRLASIRIH